MTDRALTADTPLPKWATIEWDDDTGTHGRQGFLTEYEHTELPHAEYKPNRQVTIAEPREVFRYTINGEKITIGPYFSEIRTYLEDA